MMKLLCQFSALILLFALAGCESDLTTQTGERKLLLDPTYLDGEIYTGYTFRAMVTNVPSSDVRFFWDFGSGGGYNEGGKSNSWIFYLPGIYYVRVKAQHYFTDEILGIDSVKVDVRPPAMSFALAPKTIDTILAMKSDGSMVEELEFTVTTATPAHLTRLTWDFGDGTVITTGSGLTYGHNYASVGTYTVRVSGKDASGVFLGEDSATVTIGFPPVNFSMLSVTRGVSVFLVVDSSHPLFADSMFMNPLALKLLFKKDAVSGFSFGDNKFTVTLDSTDISNPYRAHWIRDEVVGEFASDVRSIKSLAVTVNDTGMINRAGQPECGLHYKFELKDIDLLAITSSKIVYRTRSNSTADFLESVQFAAVREKNRPAGVFDDLRSESSNPPEQKTAPYALVVFDR